MELRVILDPALEHAVGEVENFGFIPVLRIEAHRMTHPATHACAALFRHPSGKQSRCHASGLDDENHALHARIEGEINGEARAIRWRFQKAELNARGPV